jgi:SAM-dependent methyltransferase
VLDLGCGTGELAAALAPGRRVVGVDPAAAMLDVARSRPGGERVQWIEQDARTLRLDERFDLILLTGHAFQVFLTEQDQHALLAAIAVHLAPNGRFIFDSRNPALRTWENRDRHNSLRRLDHPQLGGVETWNEPRYDEDTQILTYVNGYTVLATGETFSASAQIRYTEQEAIARLIEAAGLSVERWLGDWDGSAYHPSAREIIPLGRLA